MKKLIIYGALLACIFVAALLAQPAVANKYASPTATIATGGCTPDKGGPGTTIHCKGQQTYFDVSVYLGTPAPGSIPIATAHPDKKGDWSVSFTMPAVFPSGQRIPAGVVYIVVPGMNDSTQAFQFSPLALPSTGAKSDWPALEVEIAGLCIVAGVWLKLAVKKLKKNHTGALR